MNRKHLPVALAVLMTLHSCFGAALAQSKSKPINRHAAGRLTEQFYFLMSDYKIDHQGERNTLNIKVNYTYVRGVAENQYPNFIPMREDVDKFLTGYPNEMAFWEILNKELTALLLQKYPALASVTCEIQVTPSAKYGFTRGSIVTLRRSQTSRSKPFHRRAR